MRWIKSDKMLKVQFRFLVSFSIGNKFHDDVQCDVVDMDARVILSWGDLGTGSTNNASLRGYTSLRLEYRGGMPVLLLPFGDYGATRFLYGDNYVGDRTISLLNL